MYMYHCWATPDYQKVTSPDVRVSTAGLRQIDAPGGDLECFCGYTPQQPPK